MLTKITDTFYIDISDIKHFEICEKEPKNSCGHFITKDGESGFLILENALALRSKIDEYLNRENNILKISRDIESVLF